jgi:hypothetical protein
MNYWLFLKKTLERWAHQTGFIKRKKILKGFDFLVLMTVGQLGMKHPSLAGMVEAIKIKMSRVGMHRRFSAAAVVFMKTCSDYILNRKISSIASIQAKLLQPFKRILIFDSSAWEIDPELKAVFPGSGGYASEANCKLQVCYEYKQGALNFFEMLPGNTPDNAYSAQLPNHVQRGDLLLVDLGYFYLKTFHLLCERGAYFLSRFLIGTALFDSKTFRPFDLHGVLKNVKKDLHEMQVLMGENEKTRVNCRLVCLRVSQEVANERRKKIKENARRKGRIPNQKHLILADWILMVTSVPAEWLPAEMVRPFYSLRWQIELLFKQIKSVLCVHKFNTSKEHRLCCEVYGKLITAIMIHRIHAYVNTRLWNKKRKEVSMDKIYKRIQERAFIILDLLLKSSQSAVRYLKEEIPKLIKNCIKSYQRSRKTTLEILEYGL